MALNALGLLVLLSSLAAAVAVQRPQFKARVDLVQVDVVVTDRQGNPVSGLTADDFTIVEAGRAQAISQFEAFSIPLGDRDVDRRRPPAARDVVRNDEPPAPRALVIVIDNHHLTPDAEQLERLRRVLTGVLIDASNGDDVAIVFTGRSDLSVPFTRDLARQMRAIDAVKEAALMSAALLPRLWKDNVRSSLWTVRNVIGVLKGSPHGRRALLYVSEGSRIALGRMGEPSATATDEMRMTLEAATRAGVVITAIDPRGLLDGFEMRAAEVQWSFLSALALDTGGRMIANASDTRAEVRKVLRENGAFYVLGYVPEPAWRDDKFHPIEVKVRNPAWRVQARKGYYAPTRVAAAAAAEVEPADALQSALEGGLALSDVPLIAAAAPIGLGPDGKVRTLVTISIGAAEAPSAGWELAMMALTPDGRVQNTTIEPVQATDGPRGPHRIHRTIDLSTGVRPVRIVVRDRETGAIGSLHLSLDVPDLHDERLAAGGIMIGTAAAPDAIDRPVPGFEPSTDRAFRTGDEPAVRAWFFWKPEKGEELRVTATITRDGARVAGTEAIVAGSAESGRHRGLFSWALPLRLLTPGAYQLEITGEYDGRKTSRAIPFAVR